MNKLELIQYGVLILVITLGINYFLHASIIQQDKEIREKSIDFVNHFCKVEKVNNYGLDYVFDPDSKAHEFPDAPVEQIHGHGD